MIVSKSIEKNKKKERSCSLIREKRLAFKKIKENLAMSFAYNAITMSIAAGVFYGVTNSLVLTPALAALGWIISDSLVFGNSLLVRKFKECLVQTPNNI